MESRVESYKRLICSICSNKDNCNRDKMKIFEYQDKVSISCELYKNEQNVI